MIGIAEVSTANGEANRTTAKGLCPGPRIPVINGMSEASAGIYGLPHAPASGLEFGEASE